MHAFCLLSDLASIYYIKNKAVGQVYFFISYQDLSLELVESTYADGGGVFH